MMKSRAVEAVVFGVVQGVGFRPFVYRTARRLGYPGWVKNVGTGVEIHLEQSRAGGFEDFFEALEKERPPLSAIERIDIQQAVHRDCKDFTIRETRSGGSFVFISPDIAMCDNCRREMHQPSDRRHLYPFINCTDCGPRYTIVDRLPYDREKTTMSGFLMCDDCRREYTDPLNRRYHAQPIACPACGPRVQLLEDGHPVSGGIEHARRLIREGEIVAVKGLGGFHLMCDPRIPEAVLRLREVKARRFKPLALMARDLDVVREYARLDPVEQDLLLSARRPIVLLRCFREIPGIAPGFDTMGFMLPYTPLHDLLLQDLPLIVATSSNQKDAPICKDVDEGVERLSRHILTHDRPIRMRADDSVMKIVSGRPLFTRRARGYVPYPQAVPSGLRREGHILALGGELKNTVSLYRDGYVVTSQFLGDLDDYRNLAYFEETIEHLSRVFELKPSVVVSDLHPDFQSTRRARRSGLPHFQIQHHHAHVLATMIEHGLSPGKKVLGVVFDGYGYGSDGSAWGGEFLLVDYAESRRIAHFDPVPLPGGDLAARQPWRMAVAFLERSIPSDVDGFPALAGLDPARIRGIREMIARDLRCPRSSSCGRLFDAVSFLTGLAPAEVEFEAQAPMLLEAAAAADTSAVSNGYPFDMTGKWNTFESEAREADPALIRFDRTIAALVRDIRNHVDVSRMAARFHRTLAEAIFAVAEQTRRNYGIETVILAGGVFLNRILLEVAERGLTERGFAALRPTRYSPNDESISLGQIAGALQRMGTDC